MQAVEPGRGRHPARRAVRAGPLAAEPAVGPTCSSSQAYPYVVAVRSTRRQVSNASMIGWVSRNCSSRHARVSVTSTPTRRNSERTWAGLRRSNAAPGGAWRRTSRVASLALADDLVGRAWSRPDDGAEQALGNSAVDREPDGGQLRSQQLRGRLGAGRGERLGVGDREHVDRGPLPCGDVEGEVGPPAEVIGRGRPTRRPATPAEGGRRAGSGRRARPATDRGRTGPAGGRPARHQGRDRGRRAQTSPGSARHPPWRRRCTAARSQHRAIRTSATNGATPAVDHHVQRGPSVRLDRAGRGDVGEHVRAPARRHRHSHVGRCRDRERVARPDTAAEPVGDHRRAGAVTADRAGRGRRPPARRAGCRRRPR